jgi:hypothetical protein
MYNLVWKFIRENHFGGGRSSRNNIARQKGSYWFGQFWRKNYQLGTIYKRDNLMARDGVLSTKNIWKPWIIFSCDVLILGVFGLIHNP